MGIFFRAVYIPRIFWYTNGVSDKYRDLLLYLRKSGENPAQSYLYCQRFHASQIFSRRRLTQSF